MSVSGEIRNLTGDVITSFEAGIGEVGGLIGRGIDILAGFRREEESIRESLRESLATVASLRRRDFDGLTGRILDFQYGRENQIKTFIKGFLVRQRDLAARLRRSLQAGILQEVERIKRELQETIETAKAEIVSFQKEQNLIREVFAGLEARKETLSAREFKRVIGDLEAQLPILCGPQSGLQDGGSDRQYYEDADGDRTKRSLVNEPSPVGLQQSAVG